MHRLFAAIDPPPDVSSRLHDLSDDRLDVRWVDEGNHHLTLKFIGNVNTAVRDDVARALRRVSAAAPSVCLSGLSVFPSWRRPSVLVLLGEPVEALVQLHRDVEKVLHETGIQPEKKSFRPHITLARIRRERPAAVRAYVRSIDGPVREEFAVKEFRLYESSLSSSGAAYTCLAEYPLAAFT